MINMMNPKSQTKLLGFIINLAGLFLNSLYHDLSAVVDVDALLCGHAIEFPSVKRIPWTIVE